MNLCARWLGHPLTRGLDLDDPRTTELRLRIIREKSFLRQIYTEWYTSIASALPMGQGPVLELGSGGGFLGDVIPDLITSDVVSCQGIRMAMNAAQFPFCTRSLRAIVMTNVLHHLPEPRRFFAEAASCVMPGGVIVMVEPWMTRWSRWVYTRLHHEPCEPTAPVWEFRSSGPLSG